MNIIYIPTIGREDRQITYESISPKWRKNTFLVTTEAAAPKLEAAGYNVLPLDTGNGIGEVRQKIMNYHYDLYGDGWAIMMDDDLGFAIRRKDDRTKFSRMENHDQFDDMMSRLEYATYFVNIVGIASRSGANRDTEPWKRNSRICDLMAYDVVAAVENGFRFDEIPLMEDFNFALQHLRAGLPYLLLNDYVKDDLGGSNAPGGCSTYRDNALQMEAAMELAERHPQFVKIVERPGWNGMGDTRLDVRVQWAKAFKSSGALWNIGWTDVGGLKYVPA